jgi:hypothetical protein
VTANGVDTSIDPDDARESFSQGQSLEVTVASQVDCCTDQEYRVEVKGTGETDANDEECSHVDSLQFSTKTSSTPSSGPSSDPSAPPSFIPSLTPSSAPSNQPSSAPSIALSHIPSTSPSSSPSLTPSVGPSDQPSTEPSTSPSSAPSSTPSKIHSDQPSSSPTAVLPMPTASPVPSWAPSPTPIPCTCPTGSFKTATCSEVCFPEGCTCPADSDCCVSDACDICKDKGMACLQDSDTSSKYCFDCSCGSCTYQGDSCCSFNGVNNCKDGSNAGECNAQNNAFPTFSGESGNQCAGVEISDTATPNSCGCKPSSTTPCTYDPNPDEQCFICNAADIVKELTNDDPGPCDACLECVGKCVTKSKRRVRRLKVNSEADVTVIDCLNDLETKTTDGVEDCFDLGNPNDADKAECLKECPCFKS